MAGLAFERRACSPGLASLIGVFGVGPVIAATVIGEVRDVSRFKNRDHFAAYNGTAPIEASSGQRKVNRLSRRGNRRVNHAIHMAAVTQVRQPHTGKPHGIVLNQESAAARTSHHRAADPPAA
jgi:transposase